MTYIVDPAEHSRILRAQLKEDVSRLGIKLRIVGLVPENAARPTLTYAEYADKACREVGVDFESRVLAAGDFIARIKALGSDRETDGIFVFYPVFGDERDREVRAAVPAAKDIEGMNPFWLDKLYANDRFADERRSGKAVLPCTPLAIMKLISDTRFFRDGDPLPLAGVRVSVFNRSEVVGRPLAHMLANDGAEVFSFDVDSCYQVTAGGSEKRNRDGEDPDRAGALAVSDIIITGVPDQAFRRIHRHEISPGCMCLNFASVRNFSEDVIGHCAVYVPRVGPMTVTMVIRNALRLAINRGRAAPGSGR